MMCVLIIFLGDITRQTGGIFVVIVMIRECYTCIWVINGRTRIHSDGYSWTIYATYISEMETELFIHGRQIGQTHTDDWYGCRTNQESHFEAHTHKHTNTPRQVTDNGSVLRLVTHKWTQQTSHNGRANVTIEWVNRLRSACGIV